MLTAILLAFYTVIGLYYASQFITYASAERVVQMAYVEMPVITTLLLGAFALISGVLWPILVVLDTARTLIR